MQVQHRYPSKRIERYTDPINSDKFLNGIIKTPVLKRAASSTEELEEPDEKLDNQYQSSPSRITTSEEECKYDNHSYMKYKINLSHVLSVHSCMCYVIYNSELSIFIEIF
jgi:hypothetical protein